MSLSVRSVAVEGVGFGALSVALRGFAQAISGTPNTGTSARAIAVQGIGFAALLVALQGFGPAAQPEQQQPLPAQDSGGALEARQAEGFAKKARADRENALAAELARETARQAAKAAAEARAGALAADEQAQKDAVAREIRKTAEAYERLAEEWAKEAPRELPTEKIAGAAEDKAPPVALDSAQTAPAAAGSAPEQQIPAPAARLANETAQTPPASSADVLLLQAFEAATPGKAPGAGARDNAQAPLGLQDDNRRRAALLCALLALG